MARVTAHLRQTFIAGVLLMVPVAATFVLLWYLFNRLDGFLQPGVKQIFGFAIPGLGLLALLVLIYLVGLVGRNVIGRRLLTWGQGVLLRIPLVRAVYSPAKQLIESFSGSGEIGFKRVVLIEYPSAGLWTVGFLTGTVKDETGGVQALVYIPTAPTPYTGFLVVLPFSKVYDTDLSVPDAIKLVLSGGIVAPAAIRKTPVR
ncbi:MAG: DUF502 domain-containing protein [Dehalococcoidia bacterium]|nr:DUF502 domain-containing protein [Dehalococcoidia bacterium]